MITARILTPWSGKGSDGDPFRPAVAAYPLATWRDVTGNYAPADPDLLVVEAAMDAATLDAIKADSKYVVIWASDKGAPDTKPIATEEAAKMRGYLETAGVTSATAAAVVKADQPRDKVATDLSVWLKERPKK